MRLHQLCPRSLNRVHVPNVMWSHLYIMRGISLSINLLSGTWTWKFKYCDMIGCHLPSLQRNCLYIQFSQAVDQRVLAPNGNLVRLMLHESKIFKYFFQKEQWLTMLNIQFLLLPSFSSYLTVPVLFCSEWCALWCRACFKAKDHVWNKWVVLMDTPK